MLTLKSPLAAHCRDNESSIIVNETMDIHTLSRRWIFIHCRWIHPLSMNIHCRDNGTTMHEYSSIVVPKSMTHWRQCMNIHCRNNGTTMDEYSSIAVPKSMFAKCNTASCTGRIVKVHPQVVFHINVHIFMLANIGFGTTMDQKSARRSIQSVKLPVIGQYHVHLQFPPVKLSVQHLKDNSFGPTVWDQR